MNPLLARSFGVCLSLVAVAAPLHGAQAQLLPKIAVTDLSYEEQVSRYFSYYQSNERVDARSDERGRYRESDYGASASASSRQSVQAERSVTAASGYVTTIDRGELRKFTADVKGELLKSGAYRLTQGKPWTQTNTEKLYDIIARIKQGYYPGADYVLFGSINSIQFRNEASPIQGSTATTYSLALDLVAEFSLINTRTYEVKAAFSAAGEGSDARLVGMAGQTITLNKAKVMQEVSRSLGVAVANEMEAQFVPVASGPSESTQKARTTIREEKVTVFR